MPSEADIKRPVIDHMEAVIDGCMKCPGFNLPSIPCLIMRSVIAGTKRHRKAPAEKMKLCRHMKFRTASRSFSRQLAPGGAVVERDKPLPTTAPMGGRSMKSAIFRPMPMRFFPDWRTALVVRRALRPRGAGTDLRVVQSPTGAVFKVRLGRERRERIEDAS